MLLNLRQYCKTAPHGLGIRLVKITRCQILFCQQILTKTQILVDNRVTYNFSTNMGKLGKLAGALSVMGALASPAAAQESQGEQVILAAQTGTTEAVTDCVGFVREQRDLAAETGIALSRADQRSLLHQCRNNELEAIIAEQNVILAALNTEIAEIGLQIDANNQIIDEQGRRIAQIVAINGQLVIRIEETRADTAAKLAEAEAILQRLATS